MLHCAINLFQFEVWCVSLSLVFLYILKIVSLKSHSALGYRPPAPQSKVPNLIHNQPVMFQ